MIRKVVIKDSQSNGKKDFLTEATTFGELVRELDLNVTGKRVVVRETKATLQLSDALLPEGSFSLFIMPEKTKAGSYQFAANTNWSDLGHDDLRSACKERGLTAVHISSDGMRAQLDEYDEASAVQESPVIDLIDDIIEALGEVREHVANGTAAADVVEVSIEQLTADLQEVRAELNL